MALVTGLATRPTLQPWPSSYTWGMLFLALYILISLTLVYFPTRSSSTALHSAHLPSSSWWCVVGVVTYPTDPPSRDFTKPWGPMSTSEPGPLGCTTWAFLSGGFVHLWTPVRRQTDTRRQRTGIALQEKVAVRGNEETGRAVVRRLVYFVVTAALDSERQVGDGRGKGWSTQKRNFLWIPNLQSLVKKRFLSSLKISVIADFTVSSISLKPLWPKCLVGPFDISAFHVAMVPKVP